MKKHKFGSIILGAVSGLLNGLFGAGGGVAVVPMLEQMELEPQKAHATSVAIILPLSAMTAILYWIRGVQVDWHMMIWLVPFGLIGALIGSKLLKKMNQDLLRRVFGAIIVYSGIRHLLG